MRGLSVSKVANRLTNNNVNVNCIAFKENSRTLSYEVFEEVVIHRVNQRFLVRLITDSNKQPLSFKYKTGIFLSKMQGLVMAAFWPLLSVSEIYRLYKKSRKIHIEENLYCVVGCYKRIETLLAALLMKMKYPQIKFVVYTLDCMTRSMVPRILKTNIALHSIKRWERFVFTKADYICIMQSHQKHYEQEEYKQFANKFVIMDIPLFEINESTPNESINSKALINFVFTGSMSLDTANPCYFIKILELLEDLEFSFDIYGGTSCSEISDCIRNSLLFGRKLFWHGIVQPDVAAQKQKEADILISFGNDNECMIPSKIFEYIGQKKHVVHLYKSNSDSALPYFKKYGNTTLIKEQEDLSFENKRIIKELILKIPDITIDNVELLDKFYANTPKPMADFLINILN